MLTDARPGRKKYNIKVSYQEKFEDIKEVTRGRKSKDRQYNWPKENKKTNNDIPDGLLVYRISSTQ
jgi:hypothetical protein